MTTAVGRTRSGLYAKICRFLRSDWYADAVLWRNLYSLAGSCRYHSLADVLADDQLSPGWPGLPPLLLPRRCRYDESWRRSNPSRAHSWIRSANPRQPATSASLLFATWCGSAIVVYGTWYGTIKTRGYDHDPTEPTMSPKAPATASRPVSKLLCWPCSVFLRHDSPPEHMYILEKHDDLLFSAPFVL